MGLCVLVLGLCLGAGENAWGQDEKTTPQYVRSQWTAIEDGLPANDVREVVQTDDGYLWLGTEGGLTRFDGRAFERTRQTRLERETRTSDRVLEFQEYGEGFLVLYRTRDLVHYRTEGATTIADSVWAYQIGDEGQVWFGSGRDVSVYQDGTVEQAIPRPVDSEVRGLHRTDDGVLWVGTNDRGLYRWMPDGTVAHWTEEDGLLANRVTSFAESDGTMLVGTAAGLQRWTDGGLTTIPRRNTAGDPLEVVRIREAVGGTCWVQALRGVYRCRGGTLVPYQGQVRSYQPRPHFLPKTFVQEGPEGHLFVNTGRTLYRDGMPIFDTEFAIRSVEHDDEGTLWIGTGSQGLYQLRSPTFSVYGTEEGLPNNTVTTIARRRDGSVWMGTRPGALVHFRRGEPTSLSLQKGGQPLRPIFALHEDRSGQLWVGGPRLCRVQEGRCAQPERPGPIPNVPITSLHEDAQGRLWVATLGRGLYRRNAAGSGEEAEWTRFTPENSSLPGLEVRWIHESPTGALWIATVNSGAELTRYRNGTFSPIPDTLLSGENPSFIHQDTTGVLWVGTAESGLLRVDVRGTESLGAASITSYRKRDGLHHNTIYQVVSDEQGRLWMSTSNGLFWVEKSALEAVANGERERVRSVAYTTRHGLRNVEGNGFGNPGVAETADGRLWFPNQAGAVVVDPSTIPMNAPPPRLHVEAVSSGDTLVTDAPASRVALAKDQRTFNVEYTGIRTSDPAAVTFRYRLVGLEEEWIRAGDRREAFFTEVPPGEYTFEVTGRTRNGPWHAEPARLTLTVAPYFYETWWFYGLCVLLVGGVGIGLVRYRFYALRRRRERLRRRVAERTEELAAAKEEAEQAKEQTEQAKEQTEQALATVEEQAEQLRQLDEMKSRFFANVSHELRTPLSLMLGPVQQLLGRGGWPEEESEMLRIVRRNAERLQHLVEQLLDLARYDAGRLELERHRQDWDAFVEQVLQRFAPMAETQAVDLSVQTDEADRAAVFDPEHMETVLSNLVRNALAYTPEGGTVTVQAWGEGDEACLAVEDTGPGIPEEEKHTLFDRYTRGVNPSQHGGTGIGLALTKALVTLHEGRIEVDSTPGTGSTFTVRVPRQPPEREADERETRASDWTPSTPVYQGDSEKRTDGSEIADDGSTGDTAPPDRTTVLVVDDNPDVRHYVRQLLEPRYRVQEATNGQEGLKQARTGLPDLVVADVMMPEMGGFEMVRDLRQSPRTDCIPVVMLTARAEEADQVKGLEGGAEAYVTKPFDVEVLTAQIDRLIATRRELRERFETEAPASSAMESETEGTEPDSFEERVRAVVSARLSDPAFGVKDLAEEIGLARRTMSRKVKEEFGKAPSELIRAARLERGAELINDGTGTISEVAYAVGFNSLSYFSRSFKEYFGVSPSGYRKE